MTAIANETKFEEWAIVDVVGHQRYVDKVTEQVIAVCGFVRVDLPKTVTTLPWTKLIGTGSIYAPTPVSEDIADGWVEPESANLSLRAHAKVDPRIAAMRDV